MAAKKTTKPAGRPRRASVPAESTYGVRLTAEERQLAEALATAEQARVAESGLQVRVTVADVLRSLVRQEAQRRGLVAA